MVIFRVTPRSAGPRPPARLAGAAARELGDESCRPILHKPLLMGARSCVGPERSVATGVYRSRVPGRFAIWATLSPGRASMFQRRAAPDARHYERSLTRQPPLQLRQDIGPAPQISQKEHPFHRLLAPATVHRMSHPARLVDHPCPGLENFAIRMVGRLFGPPGLRHRVFGLPQGRRSQNAGHLGLGN